MDDAFLKQALAELIESTGLAIGLLAQTVAKQIDSERATANLRALIRAAEKTGSGPRLAFRMATQALAAFESESAFQKKSTH